MPRPLQEAPRMLGRYHLMEPIDEDELGQLYLARFEGPSSFQRWAVVRRLHPSLEDDAGMVAAFYEAARVAALVQHPNVAVAFDVGVRQGPTWVAREYLHGESAEDLLSRVVESKAHVPWDIACRIVADIAQGVETLYELRPQPPPHIGFLKGVITPGRAIVTYDGKSKVVEGCVPLVSGRPSLDAEALAYRAPELSQTASADVRAEVFALGVLLWELCAGSRLFGGDEEAKVRARVATRAVPPLRSSIRCPRLVDDIVQRALARKPEQRHASCRLFARELEGCLVSKGLVVSDDEVGNYMLRIFADRFEEREADLLSASNVTEVYDRAEIAARIADLTAASFRRPEPPGDDIDNTETPEINYAYRGSGAPPEAPETTRNLEPPRGALEPPSVGGDGPSTRRSGSVYDDSSETTTFRREEVETPEVTAAVFVLSNSSPQSVAMPLIERKPVPVPERKREPIRGFDELPTTRVEAPSEAQIPVPNESVVFVGDDRTVPRDPPPAADRPPGTLRFPPSYADETPSPVLAPRLTVPMAPRGAATPEPPVVAGGYPQTPGPARLPLTMPLMPPRPPSLSAVLIAHERRDSLRRLPPALFVAMGAAAVFALVAYIRWRATGPVAEDGTVFKATPTAPVPSTPVAVPVDRTPTPWNPVAVDAGVVAPKSLPPAKPPDVVPPPAPPVRRSTPAKPTAPVSPPASTGKNGLLTVLCTPACDDVLDGGRSLGPSPVFKVSVPAGNHRLTLRTTDPPAKKVVNIVVTEDDTTVVREAMDGDIGPGRY